MGADAEEEWEDVSDIDGADEDNMAILSSETEEEVESNYDEDDLSDVQGHGERICLCKNCEVEWDSDIMRVAFGLLVSPAGEPNKFRRVGVFASSPIGAGGLGFFKSLGGQSVVLI